MFYFSFFKKNTIWNETNWGFSTDVTSFVVPKLNSFAFDET